MGYFKTRVNNELWDLNKESGSNLEKPVASVRCPSLVQCVPLATEPGISLIILPLMRILQRNLKRTCLVV